MDSSRGDVQGRLAINRDAIDRSRTAVVIGAPLRQIRDAVGIEFQWHGPDAGQLI